MKGPQLNAIWQVALFKDDSEGRAIEGPSHSPKGHLIYQICIHTFWMFISRRLVSVAELSLRG